MTRLEYGPFFVILLTRNGNTTNQEAVAGTSANLKNIRYEFLEHYGFDYAKGRVRVIRLECQVGQEYDDLFHREDNNETNGFFCVTNELDAYGWEYAIDPDTGRPLTNGILSARERLAIKNKHDTDNNQPHSI